MTPSIIYSGPTREKRISGHGYSRSTHIYETDAGRLSIKEIAELRGSKQDIVRGKIRNAHGFPVYLDEDFRQIGREFRGNPERVEKAMKILNKPLGTWEREQLRGK
jgi:hypothetical protein